MKRSAEDDDHRGPGPRKSLLRGPDAADADSEDEDGRSKSPDIPSGPQHARASAAASTRNEAARQSSPTVTCPNPRNFVERLLLVLETDSAPDTIWWVDDGKSVALNIYNLKNGSTLRDHFRDIKYKFFIRNFSRWGFRRKNDFSVSHGECHYSNSMFQRDRPQLVSYMRRDSDVQDIFAEHEAETEEMISNETQQQTESSTTPGQQSSSSQDAGTDESDPPQDATNTDMNSLQHFLRLVEQNQSQPGGANNTGVALSASHEALASAPRVVYQSSEQESRNSREVLLQNIVQLSDNFLRSPADQSNEDVVLRCIMQAVVAVGQRHLEHAAAAPAAALVQQLMQNMGGGTNQGDREQAARTLQADLAELLRGFFLQQQQQQQPASAPFRTDNETAARLQEYLMNIASQQQQTGEESFLNAAGQQQPQHDPGQPALDPAFVQELLSVVQQWSNQNQQSG